jgi:hypothetical protein
LAFWIVFIIHGPIGYQSTGTSYPVPSGSTVTN